MPPRRARPRHSASRPPSYVDEERPQYSRRPQQQRHARYGYPYDDEDDDDCCPASCWSNFRCCALVFLLLLGACSLTLKVSSASSSAKHQGAVSAPPEAVDAGGAAPDTQRHTPKNKNTKKKKPLPPVPVSKAPARKQNIKLAKMRPLKWGQGGCAEGAPIRVFIAIHSSKQGDQARQNTRATWLAWAEEVKPVPRYRFFVQYPKNAPWKTDEEDVVAIGSSGSSVSTWEPELRAQKWALAHSDFSHYLSVQDDGILCVGAAMEEFKTRPAKRFMWARYDCGSKTPKIFPGFLGLSRDVAVAAVQAQAESLEELAWALRVIVLHDNVRIIPGRLTAELKDQPDATFCKGRVWAAALDGTSAATSAVASTPSRLFYGRSSAPVDEQPYSSFSRQAAAPDKPYSSSPVKPYSSASLSRSRVEAATARAEASRTRIEAERASARSDHLASRDAAVARMASYDRLPEKSREDRAEARLAERRGARERHAALRKNITERIQGRRSSPGASVGRAGRAERPKAECDDKGRMCVDSNAGEGEDKKFCWSSVRCKKGRRRLLGIAVDDDDDDDDDDDADDDDAVMDDPAETSATTTTTTVPERRADDAMDTVMLDPVETSATSTGGVAAAALELIDAVETPSATTTTTTTTGGVAAAALELIDAVETSATTTTSPPGLRGNAAEMEKQHRDDDAPNAGISAAAAPARVVNQEALSTAEDSIISSGDDAAAPNAGISPVAAAALGERSSLKTAKDKVALARFDDAIRAFLASTSQKQDNAMVPPARVNNEAPREGSSSGDDGPYEMTTPTLGAQKEAIWKQLKKKQRTREATREAQNDEDNNRVMGSNPPVKVPAERPPGATASSRVARQYPDEVRGSPPGSSGDDGPYETTTTTPGAQKEAKRLKKKQRAREAAQNYEDDRVMSPPVKVPAERPPGPVDSLRAPPPQRDDAADEIIRGSPPGPTASSRQRDAEIGSPPQPIAPTRPRERQRTNRSDFYLERLDRLRQRRVPVEEEEAVEETPKKKKKKKDKKKKSKEVEPAPKKDASSHSEVATSARTLSCPDDARTSRRMSLFCSVGSQGYAFKPNGPDFPVLRPICGRMAVREFKRHKTDLQRAPRHNKAPTVPLIRKMALVSKMRALLLRLNVTEDTFFGDCSLLDVDCILEALHTSGAVSKVWGTFDQQCSSVSSEQCARYEIRTFRDEDSPVNVLSSFPGSGNTWTRRLLEFASGYYTGSVYDDNTLMATLPAEGLDSGAVIAVKAHISPREFIEKIQVPVSKVVLLIRHPLHAIWSEFQRRAAGGHVGTLKQLPSSRELQAFSKKLSCQWMLRAVQHSMLLDTNKQIKIDVIRYEDLKTDPVRALKGILKFLDTSVDDDRVDCAVKMAKHVAIQRSAKFTAADAFGANQAYSCALWRSFELHDASNFLLVSLGYTNIIDCSNVDAEASRKYSAIETQHAAMFKSFENLQRSMADVCK